MNKITIWFGIILIVLMSSTQQSLLTIKPAKPVHTIVTSFSIYDRDDVIKFINRKTKEGYVVKQINGAGSDSYWFLVLEKY